MAKSLFPEDMMNVNTQGVLTSEIIAAKLTYFENQLHLIHWQTVSYAEHKATQKLYEYIFDFKDGLMEKLMGYTGKRPKAFKLKALSDNVNCISVVTDLMNFASELKKYGEVNSYHDVCNLADSLSGEAAKVKYLITLS